MTSMEPNDWNSKIIQEFRANGGVVGGNFAGASMILVHHQGRVSGTERVTPLVYQSVPTGYAIFASKAGAPTDPDWLHNLIAHPQTKVEVGSETVAVTARVAEHEERDRIWELQKAASPGFAEYEKSAAPRIIPVVILEPRT